MEEQARRLDGTRAKEHGTATLPPIDAALAIDHRRDAAGLVALDVVDEAGGADLGTGHHGLRQVSDVHAGLRAIATSLVACAAIHASLPDGSIGLREVARHDGGRCIAGPDA